AGIEPVVAQFRAQRKVLVHLISKARGHGVEVATGRGRREQDKPVRVAEMLATQRPRKVLAYLIRHYRVGAPPGCAVKAWAGQDIHGRSPAIPSLMTINDFRTH